VKCDAAAVQRRRQPRATNGAVQRVRSGHVRVYRVARRRDERSSCIKTRIIVHPNAFSSVRQAFGVRIVPEGV